MTGSTALRGRNTKCTNFWWSRRKFRLQHNICKTETLAKKKKKERERERTRLAHFKLQISAPQKRSWGCRYTSMCVCVLSLHVYSSLFSYVRVRWEKNTTTQTKKFRSSSHQLTPYQNRNVGRIAMKIQSNTYMHNNSSIHTCAPNTNRTHFQLYNQAPNTHDCTFQIFYKGLLTPESMMAIQQATEMHPCTIHYTGGY